MKVYCIGGSRNIGYHTSLRLLAKGDTVTFLLRYPSAFDSDEAIQKYVKQGTARLVKGDALVKEDVRCGWELAAEPSQDGQSGVDVLLFTVGGKPSFTLKGGIVSPPDLVTRAMLNTLATMSSPAPRIVAISTVGLTSQSHNALPLAVRVLHTALIRQPHADKQGVETALARVAGDTVDPSLAPPESVLPAGWEEELGLPAPGSLRDRVVIVRPALLTDGPCLWETKGPDAIRIRAEKDLPVKGGYTVSRADISYFIAERLLANEWDEYKGKGISLAN